jgi:penicillin-binding protein 1B
VNDFLLSKFQDDFQANSFRVYTTLDLNLQRAAAEAIRTGMQGVDELIRKQKRFKGQQPPEAQCALIALDPHTGEIKALAGGRNYGVSQLNHILAKRQPGSIFKPFVYTAALNTAIEGGTHILTAGTTVLDEPTTFWYDNKPYEPSNFKHEFYGTVTLRQALAKSMNVATVKVGEMVGFDAVVNLAKKAGLELQHPTHAGGGAGLVRSDAHGDGGSVHHLRERGRLREAEFRHPGARAERPGDLRQQEGRSGRCWIRGWRT